ncbi:ASI4A protein, partial [Pandion haliaetus]|nr:ASI4A protein [Pandion haliaetus]
MPIEIVCKIKFAEEDEKQKEKEEGDKESLIEEPTRPRSRDLAAFASASTLHGLGHICRSGQLGVRQTLWAFAFLASLAFFLYQAAKSALLYLEHPHVMALDEEAIREMVFPAITICNINRYRHSALTDADIFHLANMTGLPPKDRDGHKATDLLYPDPDMADIVNRTGHQLDDMLKSCNFSGENCSSRDFTVVYTRYGKCYTFNGDRRNPRVTRQGGMGNGLEIMLDIQQEEYLPIWRETNETSFEAGIRVQIHSQEEPPYIHQLGFGVSPGFQTFVSCQEQRLTYLPQPWGNCRASVQGEQTLPGYDTYSIAACRLQCEKEAVVRSCHCRMVHMPGEGCMWVPPGRGLGACSHADGCMPPDAAVEDSQERCSCPTPCNLTRYGKEISMVRMPNKGSARYLARKYNKNETYIRENFLVLDIFFEALNYEAIEQKKAYDLAGLLGDIGGQMGLFIGASILTILEILDYVYEVIRDRVSRVLRRSKPPLKKPSGSIATLGLEELKDQSPCETLGRHVEGTYNAGILPNHHHRHHYPHQGVFEDFAC